MIFLSSVLFLLKLVPSCHITWDISGPGTTPLLLLVRVKPTGVLVRVFSIEKKVVAFENGENFYHYCCYANPAPALHAAIGPNSHKPSLTFRHFSEPFTW